MLGFLRRRPGQNDHRLRSSSAPPGSTRERTDSQDPLPQLEVLAASPVKNKPPPTRSPRPSVALSSTYTEPSPYSSRIHLSSDVYSQLPSRTVSSVVVSGDPNGDLELPGKLDLTMLFEPSRPEVDIIFVHGLGGGSIRTWCYNKDLKLFWPRWLPKLPKLSKVRISTFGYDADIFSSTGATHANVDSFSRKLLHCLLTYQGSHKFGTAPTIFICHSMGGLVVKRACVVADKDPSFRQIWKNIRGIIFLGTPHRGSRQARKLTKILQFIGRGGEGKAYIKDLTVNSGLLQMLNGDFRHISAKLQLFSFYEQKETRVGSTKTMIVEPYSAVLEYPHEGSAPLLADHHLVCKYASPIDQNFITVTNTLVEMISKISPHSVQYVDSNGEKELQRIYQFLLSPAITSTEGELYSLRRKRLEHSCEWLTEKFWYKDWENEQETDGPHIIWLNGLPGTGKSIMSTFIIDRLKESGKECAYYFFGSGDASKRSFECCLLSIAYQFALQHPTMRADLMTLVDSPLQLEGTELLLIWEKVFASALLRAHDNIQRPIFVVLDAVDEADSPMDLFALLDNIPETCALRLCAVSRQSPESSQHFYNLQQKGLKVTMYNISKDNTLGDINKFVNHGVAKLPLAEDIRISIRQAILEKSEGNFLWVSLVMNQMPRSGFSKEAVLSALGEIPPGMDKLYYDMLSRMDSLEARSKALAAWIIRWTVSCFRPLSVPELQHALSFVPPDQWIEALDHWIGELCGSFLIVDSKNQVVPVHKTARDFLQKNPVSDYAITAETHTHIALVCIQVLLSKTSARLRDDAVKLKSTLAPYGRKASSLSTFGISPLSLASYAIVWWSDHLVLSSSNTLDDELLMMTNELLKSPKFLNWIQEVASCGDLQCLIKTAQNLNKYLARFDLSTATESQKEWLKLPSLWTVDLVRLTTEFGAILMLFPSSIQKLIPPLCPKHSALYQQFWKSFRGISLVGGAERYWGMRLARLMPARESVSSSRAMALACSRKLIGIGYEDGRISLWNSKTCHVILEFEFPEAVRVLCFNASGTQIAAGGEERIMIWNTSTGIVFCTIELDSDSRPIHKISFATEDLYLVAVSKHKLIIYDVIAKTLEEPFDWTEIETSTTVVKPNHSPIAQALNVRRNLLAVAYRGLPVTAWDIEKGELFGVLKAGGKNPLPKGVRKPSSFARRAMQAYDSAGAIEFNTVTDAVYVAYQDGSLIRWNPYNNEQKRARHEDAYIIKCHPDGTLIATAGSTGTIRIWNADSLDPAFVIETDGESVTDLCFSPDPNGHSLYDIRANYCSVWEPEILLRGAKVYKETKTPMEEDNLSIYLDPISITSICISPDGITFLVGTEDGWVYLYTVQTGKKLKDLYRHASTVSVTFLTWSRKGDLIASGDNSGRFFVFEIRIEIVTPVVLRPQTAITSNWYADTIEEEGGGDTEGDEEVAKYNITKMERVLSGRLGEGEAIRSMAIQSENKRLLIVTSAANRFWDLISKNEEPVYSWLLQKDHTNNPTESSIIQSRIALNHPQNLQEVMLITSSEVRILPWFYHESAQIEKKTEITNVSHSQYEQTILRIVQPSASHDERHTQVVMSDPVEPVRGEQRGVTYIIDLEDAKISSDGQFLVLCQRRKSVTDNKTTKYLRAFKVADIDRLRLKSLMSSTQLAKSTDSGILNDIASIGLQSSAYVLTQNPLTPRRDIQIDKLIGIVGHTVYTLTAHKTVCSWNLPSTGSPATSRSSIPTASTSKNIHDSRSEVTARADSHVITKAGKAEPAQGFADPLKIHLFFPHGAEVGLIAVGPGKDIVLTREKTKVVVVRRALEKDSGLA